jgi:hypothetical protein
MNEQQGDTLPVPNSDEAIDYARQAASLRHQRLGEAHLIAWLVLLTVLPLAD